MQNSKTIKISAYIIAVILVAGLLTLVSCTEAPDQDASTKDNPEEIEGWRIN